MNLLTEITKRLSQNFSINPQKISQTIKAQKCSSSRLKEVLKELSLEDLTNFLWLSTLKPECQFNEVTLSILRDTNIKAAKGSLHKLKESQLISQISTDECYILHESLRVFAKHLLTSYKSESGMLPRLGVNWVDAHQQIILILQGENINLKLRKDIYFLKNLTWHLQQAEWESKIHTVMSNLFPLKQWHHTLVDHAFSDFSQIEKLIQQAEADAKLDCRKHPEQALMLLTKYGLMRNTQRLLLQNVPEQWVKRLLESQHWQLEQGLAYILSQTDSIQKAQSISALSPLLLPLFSSEILNEIDKIKLDSARTTAIVGVFSQLNTKEKKIALNYVKELKTEAYQSLCISNIAPHLPLPLMQQTYGLIEQLEDENDQAKALESFLEVCTKPFKRQGLSLIKTYTKDDLKLRLLHQLAAIFPEVQTEIIQLAKNIEPDYTSVSILWENLNQEKQSIGTLLDWLKGDMSDLDKVLFFIERVSEANEQQLKELWGLVRNRQDWYASIGQTSSKSNEANWANAVMSFMGLLSTQDIQDLIPEIASLNSQEITGELCLQLFPFIEDVEQYHALFQLLNRIEDLETRTKLLSQATEYIPEAKTEVQISLDAIANPISKLEIQVILLEQYPELTPAFLQEIEQLKSDRLTIHFLSQAFDLLPEKYLSEVTDLIFKVSDLNQRKGLLNQLEQKLDVENILEWMMRIYTLMYPSSQFQNAAKQIYRNYWESGLKDTSSELPEELLAQLPHRKKSIPSRTNEVLSEIFSLLNRVNQSKVLSIYLQEVEWNELDIHSLMSILEILSQGSPLDFLQSVPSLTQGIAEIRGSQHLPVYGNLCNQLSQTTIIEKKQTTPESRENICHKFEPQGLWQKIA